MRSRPLIQNSLRFLSLVCLNPLSPNLWNRIVAICIASLGLSTFTDAYLVVIFNYHGIDSSMKVIFVVAITQVTTRLVFLLTYRKEIIILITKVSTFWKPNFCNFSQQEKNEKIFKIVKYCTRLYIVLLLLVCLIYSFRPIIFGEVMELPWKSYCSKFLKHKVCYGLQVYQITIYFLICVGFDSLYISVIANIICEYKLIKKHFSDLKFNPMLRGTDAKTMEKLRKLIDHHNLILECTEIIKHIYKVPFLSLFLSSVFGMGFTAILASGNGSNVIKIQFGMMTMYYLIELYLFCLSGSHLAVESVKLSFEVYKLKWWIKAQPELQRVLIMVMRRSNKPEILTVGGLLEILKSWFSFFTFVQVIYGKN